MLVRVNTVPVLDEAGETRHVEYGTLVGYRRQSVAIETVPVGGTVRLQGGTVAWVEPAYADRPGRPSVAQSDVLGPRVDYRFAAPTARHERVIGGCDRTPNRGTAHVTLVPAARGDAAGTVRVTISWLDGTLSPARRTRLARTLFELAELEDGDGHGAWRVTDLDHAQRAIVAACAQLGIMPLVNRLE